MAIKMLNPEDLDLIEDNCIRIVFTDEHAREALTLILRRADAYEMAEDIIRRLK